MSNSSETNTITTDKITTTDTDEIIKYLRSTNDHLYEIVDHHNTLIHELVLVIKQNKNFMYKNCNHQWERDLAEIEKTAYYCVKCNLTQKHMD